MADYKVGTVAVFSREGYKVGEYSVNMEKGRDITWDEFLNAGEGQDGGYVELEANEPLFILPTSGTTKKTKTNCAETWWVSDLYILYGSVDIWKKT